MKTIRYFLSLFAVMLVLAGFAQRPTMELTFTAFNGDEYLALDSILVKNVTHDVDTMLYWPDTILVIDYITGINDPDLSENDKSIALKCYPNPFKNQASVELIIHQKEQINITITDLLGKSRAVFSKMMDAGIHSLKVKTGHDGLYMLTTSSSTHSKTIRLVNLSKESHNGFNIEYAGLKGTTNQEPQHKAQRDGFGYDEGDQLLYAGFIDGIESGLMDAIPGSQTIFFQFASNMPCPGLPTVSWGGQIYNTVQIYSQCWLKENLNIGSMIAGGETQNDNTQIEKWCYNNSPSNCDLYGGMYQWDEMMAYTTGQGGTGICPPGWHIPSDNEWKVLEGAADSQYGIGSPEWNNGSWNGYDAGKHLKSTEHWDENGNGTDELGFSGFPGGYCLASGSFNKLGQSGRFWSSTLSSPGSSYTFMHQLEFNVDNIYRYNYNRNMGHSVRCIKN